MAHTPVAIGLVSILILLSVALAPATPATAGPNCINIVPGANLSRCDYTGFSLVGLDLSGANLRGATFSTTTLQHVNLAGANLHGAVITNRSNFNMVNLSGANFSDVTGSGSGPTILRNVNLMNANVSGLTIDQGFLDRVDFRGSNYFNVTITNSSLIDIVCPDGTRQDSPCT